MSHLLCVAAALLLNPANGVEDADDAAPVLLADGQTVQFPLFDSLKNDYDRYLDEWTGQGRPETALNPAIEWMPDFRSAIEKATRENRPIFSAFYVRENGDPACDV